MSSVKQAYLSDEKIIELFLQSHQDNYFNILYDRHFPQVYKQCMGLCKHKESAQDISQEVFVKLHKQLHQFEGKARFSSWLFQVTRNVCLDFIRKEKKHWHHLDSGISKEVLLEMFEEEEEAPEENTSTSLQQQLTRLPLLEKEILMMKYGFDWPIEEIATFMEMSEGAIKMRLKRAKDKLRNENIFPN